MGDTERICRFCTLASPRPSRKHDRRRPVSISAYRPAYVSPSTPDHRDVHPAGNGPCDRCCYLALRSCRTRAPLNAQSGMLSVLMDDSLELMPVRRGLVISALVEILAHAGGLAVSLPFYGRRSPTFIVGLSAALAAVVGLVGWVSWRYALRRVVAPPPRPAVIVSEEFPVRDVLWSVGWACLLIVASLTGLLSPAFFGPGIGTGMAKLWSARKIGEFERSAGRRVLGSPRRSPWGREHLTLYADNV